MLNNARFRKEEQREKAINEETPLTWQQYRDLSDGGFVTRPHHLLRRLQIETVPAEIRGIIEIQKNKAEKDHFLE